MLKGKGGEEFSVRCEVAGMRLSLMPADGQGIGISVAMNIAECEGLIEALRAEVAAARARAAQASGELREITGG